MQKLPKGQWLEAVMAELAYHEDWNIEETTAYMGRFEPAWDKLYEQGVRPAVAAHTPTHGLEALCATTGPTFQESPTSPPPEPLRDLLAAHALAGLLSSGAGDRAPHSEIAANAYRYADAMLKARTTC